MTVIIYKKLSRINKSKCNLQKTHKLFRGSKILIDNQIMPKILSRKINKVGQKSLMLLRKIEIKTMVKYNKLINRNISKNSSRLRHYRMPIVSCAEILIKVWRKYATMSR